MREMAQARGVAGSCFAALGHRWGRGGLHQRGPFRDVLLAFAATVARMERDRLIERTKAGLARARAQVRVGGRPRNLPLVEAALKILAEGASDEDVRKRYGEPASTLRRYRSVLRAARSSG